MSPQTHLSARRISSSHEYSVHEREYQAYISREGVETTCTPHTGLNNDDLQTQNILHIAGKHQTTKKNHWVMYTHVHLHAHSRRGHRTQTSSYCSVRSINSSHGALLYALCSSLSSIMSPPPRVPHLLSYSMNPQELDGACGDSWQSENQLHWPVTHHAHAHYTNSKDSGPL